MTARGTARRPEQALRDISELVGRATLLSERLGNGAVHRPSGRRMEDGIRGRLDQLLQSAAGGDPQMFSRWLQWSGVTTDALHRALQEPPPPDSNALPPWANTLADVLTTAGPRDPDARYGRSSPTPDAQARACVDEGGRLRLPPVEASFAGEPAIPFAEVLAPAVRVARRKLLSRLKTTVRSSPAQSSPAQSSPARSPLALISAPAYSSLERSLFSRLSFVASPVLLAKFTDFRPVGINLLVSLGAMAEQAAERGTSHYAEFVRQTLRDGLRSLVTRYPVLGRFVAVTVDQWVDGTAEFLERLRSDWHDVAARFSDRELGLVTATDATLSDAHHGGRSAVALVFDTGLGLIYKPKSVALERCYVELLDWCNRRGLSLSLKTHAVLDRHTHGWAELVAERPCEDESAVARFYRRAGMQLCLLYVLGASDCHAENLIACGEHLVLVDMETLLYAEPAGMSPADEPGSPDSVLRAGLLPCWDCRYDTRHAIDVSGLGFSEAQGATQRRWMFVNTDAMHVAWGEWPAGSSRNVPKLRGVAQTPLQHIPELTSGFEEMYRLLMRHREALLGPGGPVAAMREQPVRFIFRPTFVYFRILEAGLGPRHLVSGIDCGIQLEQLSYAFLGAEDQPKPWPILAAERAALEQLDIPYFGCQSDSEALTEGLPRPLERYFRQSSYRDCTARVRRLSASGLALQLELIRGSMYCKVAGAHEASVPGDPPGPNTRASVRRPRPRIAAGSFERGAQAIAEQIRKRSIRGARGEIDWLGVSYFHKAGRFQVRPLGDNLFDGRCGVALFLAAHGRVADDRSSRDLALETLDPLRQRIRSAKQDPVGAFGSSPAIGAAMGLGSIVYVLVRAARFLDDPSLLAEAQEVADLLAPARITGDRELDVMNGAAGALLSLLALYEETSDPRSLRRARLCGEHLVKTSSWHDATMSDVTTSDATTRDGPTGESRRRTPVIGFAHGTAGVCYSLLRLYALTDERAFLRAAEDGLEYERARFPIAATRGPAYDDGSETVPSGLMGSWCNGIPGIALGRSSWLWLLDRVDAQEEVEAALGTTEGWPLAGIDHVCCGGFGRIEVLLVAADKLSRARLRTSAHAAAATLMRRARGSGSYQLYAGSFGSPLFKPSFFQGVAGIGYELLRLAHPEALPSVLLWA